jgi:hypothetical protein
MTRVLLVGLLSLLALITVPAGAWAQSTAVQCFGPVVNSVICSYTSSTNTTDGSPSTGSAQTIVNATLSTPFMLAQPIKMRAEGRLTTASASGTRAWTVATSWGGNSLTLFSSLTLTAELSATPFWVECDLVSTSPTSNLAKALTCEAGYVSVDSVGSGSTIVRSKRRTTYTMTQSQTQTITVSSTLTSTAGLGLVVDRVTWNQGN